MASTIVENYKKCKYGSRIRKISGDIAKSGGKVVNETVEGMNRIAAVVESAAENGSANLVKIVTK
jgi:methyl-accepting chemotaxis protein